MVDDPKRAILGFRSRLQRPSDDPKGRSLEIKSSRHLVVDDPNRAILSLRSFLQHSSDDPKGIFHDMRSIRYLVVDDPKRAILGLRSFLIIVVQKLGQLKSFVSLTRGTIHLGLV